MYEKLFSKIYIERDIAYHPRAKSILADLAYPAEKIEYIDCYEDIFSRKTKAYLKKRSYLALFIAVKKGKLVKEAPSGYAAAYQPRADSSVEAHAYPKKKRHFYFIHAYNCIYECTYCYLQGYFKSPDIVLFINHEEILLAMQQQIDDCRRKNELAVFHSGEFSDSLALSPLSKELPLYWKFFAEHPNAFLELRSKSLEIRALQKLQPLPNVSISMSLSTEQQYKRYELKTPNPAARLKQLANLAELGFSIGLHLDPLIYDEGFKAEFKEFSNELFNALGKYQRRLNHISLGVIRFSNKSWKAFKENYPNNAILSEPFHPGFDSKLRYLKPLRKWVLNFARDQLCLAGFSNELIYDCMDD